MQDKLDAIAGKLFLINAAIEQAKIRSLDVINPILSEVIEELSQLKEQQPESKAPTAVELPIDLIKKRGAALDIVLNLLDLMHVVEVAAENTASREYLFGPLNLAIEQLYLVRDALQVQ